MTHAVGSNRPYAFPTSAPEGDEVATKITITPDSNSPPHAVGFFGEDGLSFADVLDAVNPLKHIPIVSDLIYDRPEEKSSVAANLVSGALMGGPIGFVASIANEVFKSATGKGMAETVVAALSGKIGSEPETQLAAATAVPSEEKEEVQVALADIPVSEEVRVTTLAPASPPAPAAVDKAMRALDAERAAEQLHHTTRRIASASSEFAKDEARAKAMLELFGGSKPSASRAYQNAQMLPYLKQANTNQLL